MKMAMNMVQMQQAKPYSFKDLERLYGVSHKTFKNWIEPFEEEIGEKRGRYFTVKQVETIFTRLGLPPTIDD